MTTALIFAGGAGQRMHTYSKPKQFLELNGKPIILYTLEHFERHPEVDTILVVCIEDWIETLKRLLRIYEFKKVVRVVPGGDSGDKSIYSGLKALDGICSHDDIVLIHDGVRPLITAGLISANIAMVRDSGTAITVEAASESIVRLRGGMIAEVPPRAEMFTAKAPQSFRYGMIMALYELAVSEGIGTIDSAHLCAYYGVSMHTVKSTPNNIKVTSPADFYILRALFEARENQQVLGF
jgi:2-C-methyl-D-erythritol 4-phosphate cytidylyltransferase